MEDFDMIEETDLEAETTRKESSGHPSTRAYRRKKDWRKSAKKASDIKTNKNNHSYFGTRTKNGEEVVCEKIVKSWRGKRKKFLKHRASKAARKSDVPKNGSGYRKCFDLNWKLD